MARRALAGVWTGRYEFDPIPDFTDLPTPTPFVMRLSAPGFFGGFGGEVTDGPRGMPERGAVKGRVRGDRVSFLKLMPVAYVFHEGQQLTLSEFAQEVHDMMPARSYTHTPIRYAGRFRPDGRGLEGVWEIWPHTVYLSDGRDTYALAFGACAGRWAATRADG